MTLQVFALTFYALRPRRVAEFWAAVLGRELVEDPQVGVVLLPGDEVGFRLRFVATDEPKVGQNSAHFDLTSQSREEQQQTVARALALGGRHVDVGQLPEEEHVVLGDPEGNEFCVIEEGNNFLAGCGFIGALACDGSRAVGCFWSEALGWPLVWDKGEETAIQSPRGGPKITWGGPAEKPKSTRNRLYFDLVPAAGSGLEQEVERLIALGATRLGANEAGWVELADPDGNELWVMPPR